MNESEVRGSGVDPLPSEEPLKTSSEFVLNSFDVYWGIRLGEAGVVAQISTVAGRRPPVGPHPLVYTSIIDGPLAQLVEQLTLNQ